MAFFMCRWLPVSIISLEKTHIKNFDINFAQSVKYGVESKRHKELKQSFP